MVRGLARDDEARKLCPKGLELCFPGTNGRFAYNTADGVLNPLLNEVSLSKEWGAVAAFLHYWTPQLRSGFQLAYSKVDMPSLGGFFVGGFTNPAFGPTGALTTTGVVRDWTSDQRRGEP